MKRDKYDYSDYGAFKQAASQPMGSRFYQFARMIGLKNRYLRFLRIADRNKPVLEIGCGNGKFLQEMLDAGFTSVRGIELSPTYQPVVDSALIVQGAAVPYLESCVRESIGTIVALDVFEHIPATELHTMMHLIYERLMPGGIVVFRVPNMASPVALINYFGDLSHVTPLNEGSIRHLIFDSGLTMCGLYPEPFAYPRSLSTIAGIFLWPIYKFLTDSAMAAFGIHAKVLTPNLVCVLSKLE